MSVCNITQEASTNFYLDCPRRTCLSPLKSANNMRVAIIFLLLVILKTLLLTCICSVFFMKHAGGHTISWPTKKLQFDRLFPAKNAARANWMWPLKWALCTRRSHDTKITLLDGKWRSGTFKRKVVSFLNEAISLFFLPLCVVWHSARCFFVSCDRIMQRAHWLHGKWKRKRHYSVSRSNLL